MLLLVIAGAAYATFPPRMRWIPAELEPESTAPGESATYTVTLKHTERHLMPATNQLKAVAEGDIAPFVTINQPSFPRAFKRGNEVNFSVNVAVPPDTPLSVKNRELVLKRILRNGKVKNVRRADTLPVELTFPSIPLPPDPDEEGKADLLGIDPDGNSVRGDIDPHIVMIHVKFRVGTNTDSPLLLIPAELREAVANVKQLFSLSDQQLDSMGAGRMKLWFEIKVKPETDMNVFLERLRRLDHVEAAEPAPKAEAPPGGDKDGASP